MKKKNKMIPTMFFVSITIPTILSSFAACCSSISILIMTIITMFLMLKIPIFKHRENLWMFVIATFTTLPVNIFLIKAIGRSDFLDYNNILSDIFSGFVIYAVLFAVEQIILGVATRLIYRKQYKLI